MHSIFYDRAADPAHALKLAQQPGARFIGGGTNLLDHGGHARLQGQSFQDQARRARRGACAAQCRGPRRMGAARDGKLAAVMHDTVSSTSFIDDFPEPCSIFTRALYSSDSLRTTQRMATLNLGVPTYMRAPGESSGSFAL
jgi:hypothetical protein